MASAGPRTVVRERGSGRRRLGARRSPRTCAQSKKGEVLLRGVGTLR